MEKRGKVYKKALNKLIHYGVLVPYGSLELYHGRAGDGEEWKVDPWYDNSKNNTGNNNINVVSALSTGGYDVARDFAFSRMKKTGGAPDVYRILTKTDNCYIYNKNIEFLDFNEKQRQEISNSLAVLGDMPIDVLDPVDFQYRDSYASVKAFVDRYQASTLKGGMISYDDMRQLHISYLEKYGRVPSVGLFEQIAGSLNAKFLFARDPHLLMGRFIFETDPTTRRCVSYLNEKQELTLFPINQNYIASWLGANNIIGVMRDVNSATLNRPITPTYIFDKTQIETEDQQKERLQKNEIDFGGVSRLLEGCIGSSKINEFLMGSSTIETMEFFNKNADVKSLLKKDAGLWEGFSIGEHTETVMRVFENTFENELPKELLPFMKLVILSHDLGKGLSKDKKEQKMFTEKVCISMYNKLKIPQNIQNLLLFIIGDSQNYTTEYYVKKNVIAEYMLKQAVDAKLKECFNKSSSDVIDGVVSLCKMLQTCDSGAYTRYGVTRDKKTGIYYRNGNDGFTKGFKPPADLKRQSLVFYEPNEMC